VRNVPDKVVEKINFLYYIIMECKDLELRRQIGEFENGNAEE
jgi:hypothetical protein